MILQLHLTRPENARDFFFNFLKMYFLRKGSSGISNFWFHIFYYPTKDVLINRTKMPSIKPEIASSALIGNTYSHVAPCFKMKKNGHKGKFETKLERKKSIFVKNSIKMSASWIVSFFPFLITKERASQHFTNISNNFVHNILLLFLHLT